MINYGSILKGVNWSALGLSRKGAWGGSAFGTGKACVMNGYFGVFDFTANNANNTFLNFWLTLFADDGTTCTYVTNPFSFGGISQTLTNIGQDNSNRTHTPPSGTQHFFCAIEGNNIVFISQMFTYQPQEIRIAIPTVYVPGATITIPYTARTTTARTIFDVLAWAYALPGLNTVYSWFNENDQTTSTQYNNGGFTYNVGNDIPVFNNVVPSVASAMQGPVYGQYGLHGYCNQGVSSTGRKGVAIIQPTWDGARVQGSGAWTYDDTLGGLLGNVNNVQGNLLHSFGSDLPGIFGVSNYGTDTGVPYHRVFSQNWTLMIYCQGLPATPNLFGVVIARGKAYAAVQTSSGGQACWRAYTAQLPKQFSGSGGSGGNGGGTGIIAPDSPGNSNGTPYLPPVNPIIVNRLHAGLVNYHRAVSPTGQFQA